MERRQVQPTVPESRPDGRPALCAPNTVLFGLIPFLCYNAPMCGACNTTLWRRIGDQRDQPFQYITGTLFPGHRN